MKKFIILLSITSLLSISVQAADGMINVMSQSNVESTTNRLGQILTAKGMTIFSIIKHSENASRVGVALGDTELIIFGNPKAGSPLMKCQQTIAIDLPQKFLVWKDENEVVWISYNDIRYLEKRHAVQNCGKLLSKLEKVLAGIAKSASNP